MITKIKIKSSPKLDTGTGESLFELIEITNNLQRTYSGINKILSYVREYPDEPIDKLIRISTGLSPRIRNVGKTNRIYILGHIRIYEQINRKNNTKKKVEEN